MSKITLSVELTQKEFTEARSYSDIHVMIQDKVREKLEEQSKDAGVFAIEKITQIFKWQDGNVSYNIVVNYDKL